MIILLLPKVYEYMTDKVLLVDLRDESESAFKGTFSENGYDVTKILQDIAIVDSHIKLDKNIQYLVVNIESPNEMIFSGLEKLANKYSIPIVVFSKTSTQRFTEAAATIGLSAYIVNGFVPDRIKHILDLAKARFKEVKSMKEELEKTKSILADRKVIEKAKGILMRRRTIDEDSAFRMMRKMAMDKNQKLSEVASSIINADTLFN